MAELTKDPVRAEAAGDRRLLHLEGRVTVAQARRLLEVAPPRLGKEGRGVHVRCEHLTHLDCAGIQVLLGLNETLRGQGALSLENVPESIQQTLRIAGLSDAW